MSIKRRFILIPRGSICMTNLPCSFSHALAQLLDLLLLPLVIFFPFDALRRFGLSIGVIVPLVFFEPVVMLIDLKDLVDRPVQKLPVMRYHQYSPPIAREVGLKPFHAREVEMIGRFIEQQQVWRSKQQRGKADARLLSTGEGLYLLGSRKVGDMQT